MRRKILAIVLVLAAFPLWNAVTDLWRWHNTPQRVNWETVEELVWLKQFRCDRQYTPGLSLHFEHGPDMSMLAAIEVWSHFAEQATPRHWKTDLERALLDFAINQEQKCGTTGAINLRAAMRFLQIFVELHSTEV